VAYSIWLMIPLYRTMCKYSIFGTFIHKHVNTQATFVWWGYIMLTTLCWRVQKKVQYFWHGFGKFECIFTILAGVVLRIYFRLTTCSLY